MNFHRVNWKTFTWFLTLVVPAVSSNPVCDVISASAVEGDPAGAVTQVLEKYEGALLLLLGFGGISVLVAASYNIIRSYVFRDVSSLDSAFDAGGRVTTSLTAVTVGMQLLWPADFLQSATVTVRLGIAGAFWYSAAVATVILLFPLLSVEFKTRAPGAKTYLQLFYLPEGPALPFGDLGHIYDRLQCLQGPKDNEEQSFTTFWSAGSLVWMVQAVFIAAAVTFCDQASWQSRIAAKPAQGVIGFIVATFLWFAVPSTIGTSIGVTYLSFSAHNANVTLSNADIDAGLTVPYIVQYALGREGSFIVLTIFTMLMMSTGSGEVMAISSIIVYDICQSYVWPFRQGHKVGHCIICSKVKGDSQKVLNTGQRDEKCQCPPVIECLQCALDQELILTTQGLRTQMIHYTCEVHGQYRSYQDIMVRFKNWCIMGVTLGIVPFGLIMISTGVDLNWIFLTGCIVTIPCFPGSVLCILWVKVTAKGMVIGSLCGLLCGVGATLLKASALPGGLGDFVLNTSDPLTVLVGACVSFFVTLIVTIVVSVCTHAIKSEDDARREWEKLRDIDNPLNPWLEFYRDEFPEMSGNEKPTYKDMEKVFRKGKVAAIVGSACCILLFVVVIPGSMASMHVLDAGQFRGWVTAMHSWCFIMAGLAIVVAPLEEVVVIVRELRQRGIKKLPTEAAHSSSTCAGNCNNSHQVHIMNNMATTKL
ncbi:hypothetical protein C0Q70_14290 [Pomacea canaliculata]|uniref:Uncharacterized protein n=1 Tax=Pomacea canaliculata TaxID=400727 RepID=A0A2T7NZN8_POMCA|nr:hypothetical protein C0Q70_14290 [Pomacea canaliculata]